MDRRDFIAAAAGGVATAATGVFSSLAFAAEENSSGELKHPLILSDAKVLAQLEVVAKTASDCVAAAKACVQHCLEELLAGNAAEFKNCAIASNQMIPVCESISTLASLKATSIADFLDGCIKTCEACRVACKEHEPHFAHGMHKPCKRCMEACLACRDACTALKKLL